MAQNSGSGTGIAPSNYNYAVVDGSEVLEETYRLRYQVYCLERNLLDAKDYPYEYEKDQFDDVSIHVAAIDKSHVVAGTLRLIQFSPLAFPLLKHCELYEEYADLANPNNPFLKTAGEISRLAVLERYRRRKGDGAYGFSTDQGHPLPDKPQVAKRRSGEIVIGIYKTMYQISKRNGITHWLAAMETNLWRALNRFKFTFTPIGPESEYLGKIVPYMASISELEKKVSQENPELFAEFVKGLDVDHVSEAET